MITGDTEAADLRGSPPETTGAPGLAVRLAWHPNKLGLAQAYVTGEIGALAFEDGCMGVDQIPAVRTDGMDL